MIPSKEIDEGNYTGNPSSPFRLWRPYGLSTLSSFASRDVIRVGCIAWYSDAMYWGECRVVGNSLSGARFYSTTMRVFLEAILFNIVGKELAPLTRTGGSPQARAWSPRMTTTPISCNNYVGWLVGWF